MRLLSKIKNKLRGKSPAKAELENLVSRGLKLGKNVDIFSDYCFDSLYPGLISVGNNVTISTNVKILAHDAGMGYFTNGSVKIGIVEIGNNVFIGQGVTILCNTRIGDNVVIGAGSVVTGDVPSGTVYAGNPARFIKSIEEFTNQHMACIQSHPNIKKPWREIRDLKADEFEMIREQLKDTYGYIVRTK